MFNKMRMTGVAALAAALLAGCADNRRPATASSGGQASPPVTYSHDPFPSTYRTYPGVPTLVRNVTIYDGEGGRI